MPINVVGGKMKRLMAVFLLLGALTGRAEAQGQPQSKEPPALFPPRPRLLLHRRSRLRRSRFRPGQEDLRGARRAVAMKCSSGRERRANRRDPAHSAGVPCLRESPCGAADKKEGRSMGTLSKASRRAAGKRRFLGLFGAWAPLALAFVLPLSGARAGEDCRSLDIHLDAAAGFTDITCDSLADSHADISDTREMIFAHDSRSVFVIRHLAAGNRTYLELMAPKDLIESAFAKAEGWAAGPGGNGYAAVRFTGWRKVS